MTAPFPPVPPPGRPEGPPGGEHISLGKALILLVAAVVVGVLCLQVGARPTVDAGTAAGAPTTTTTAPPKPVGPTTTTTTTAPNPDVKVLVANGGTVDGAAAYFTAKLDAEGWSTLTPTNATPVTASAVYYAAGQQQPADAIATSLGLATTVVKPLATATPVAGATGADVVLVVGPDLSSQVTPTTAGTTTTTAATTTTGTTTTGTTTTGTTTTAATTTATTTTTTAPTTTTG